MYSLARWRKITNIHTGPYANHGDDVQPRREIELKATGSDIPTDPELPIVRELLTEALSDLAVADKTISLVHSIRQLLVQTIHNGGPDTAVEVSPDIQYTPGGLLILWYTRTERVARLRAALAPQKKLPPELLAKIFVDACSDRPLVLPPRPRCTLHVIILVCARWRRVALNEPLLWSNLAITTRNSLGPNFPRRMGEIFARNAGIPISLKIDSDGYYGEPLEGTPITDVIVPHLSLFQTLDLTFPTICFSPLFESAPGSVDSLESLRLDLQWGYGIWENFNVFRVDRPVTVFSAARNLRAIDIQSEFNHGRWIHLLPDALHLPWAQLTSLRLGPAVALTPIRAHDVLRQSARLVNCRLDLTTSWASNDVVDTSQVLCPDLESLYLFVINDADLGQFLHPLILPSFKDFTCTSEGYSCEQGELASLIRRSECSITSITMKSRRMETVDETLLEELSFLTHIEAMSVTFTSTVFERMSQRQLLPKLEVLRARVDCAGSFVDMLEARQRDLSLRDGEPHPRPRVIGVSCNDSVPRVLYDAAIERLNKVELAEGESFTMRRD